MGDAAALRVKANEVEKEEKMRSAMEGFTWPEKTLPTRDEQVQPFVWLYGAHKLIAENKLVREILDVGEALPLWGETWSFHDNFVESDAMRVELLDRLYMLFNARAKRHAADHVLGTGHVGRFNERMRTMYAMYEPMLSTAEDKLLLMQALYEELKPETQKLIKLCTTKKQLQRSMFIMRETPTQKKRRLFDTPLAHTQEGTAAFEDRFDVVDAHISHLEGVLDEVEKNFLGQTLATPQASDARLDLVGQL